MTTETTIPAGYWPDARGALFPISTIKAIDKDRTKVVTDLCEEAKKLSSQILAFKLAARQQLDDFIERSATEYKVELRGAKGKGNVTLSTFSGNYKVVRQVADTIVFDERLQIAKQLIDNCILRWSKGSNAYIKALVNSAFQVDKAGKINTGRIFALLNVEIDDEEWACAMTAIRDSMRISSSKSYERYYERVDASGEYVAINLDVAAV